MGRSTVVAFLAFAASLAIGTDARAQECNQGWYWTGYPTIPVIINKDMAENLLHSNGVAWTDDQLLREIQYTLNTLTEQEPTNLGRFVVSIDTMNRPWTASVPGAIYITAWLGTGCEHNDCACGATGDQAGDPTVGVRIQIKRSATGVVDGVDQGLPDCGFKWDQFREDIFPIHTVRNLINHEFSHGLGMAHRVGGNCSQNWEATCTTQICSVMDGNEGDDELIENPYAWDRTWMGSAYAPFSGTGRRMDESSTGLSWVQVTGLPTTGPLLAASSAYNSTFLFVDTKTLNTWAPTLYKYISATWTSWGASSSIWGSLGQLGIAHSASPFDLWVSNMGFETNFDTIKDLQIFRKDINNNTIGTFVESNLTRSQGVSSAFDSKSGFVIFSWRDTNRRIILQRMTADGVAFGNPTQIPGPTNSGDTAEIACGDASLSYNCVVVWASASPLAGYRTMKWQHFRLVYDPMFFGWHFVFSNVFDSGYIVAGPPSVAYKGFPSSTCAWVFSWSPGGDTYYTRCKSASETATLTAGTEVSHRPSQGSALWSVPLGASLRNNTSYIEALSVWK